MAYTSITITAPSGAKKGVKVSASVTVKNIKPIYDFIFKGDIYAVPESYHDYIIGSIDQIITSGSSVTRNVSFIMPDCNVTIFIWLEFWTGTKWVYDNSASKVVTLEAAPITYHLDVFVPSWGYGGSVSPGSGDYAANTTVTLKATPLSSYKFVSWGVDASGTNPTFNLYMNSNKYVEAYFEKVPVPTEWVPLAEVTISVAVPEIAVGWYELYSTQIQVSVPEIAVGWYELYNTTIQINVPVPIPPIPPVPPEEEEKEFPWVPAILIGGGVVLAASALKKPKT